MDDIKILIGGDFVPTNSNIEYFTSGKMQEVTGSRLYTYLKEADFVIHNLEVPLTDETSPIDKYGPCLIAPSSAITGLKEINPFFYTLANNHILDQGVKGLKNTIDLLDREGIAHAGAGLSKEEISKFYYAKIKEYTIGIYCCCEKEFSVTKDDNIGANMFDPLFSLDVISEAKKKCDYIIVLYHGGKEHYRYPSPYLQKVCRRIIDKGADLVICQHSHCIGCKEQWNKGMIVYGQGNFLFDYGQDECWDTSLVIQLVLSKRDSNPSISFIPLTRQNEKVAIAEGEMAVDILKKFNERSEKIQDPLFVKIKYAEFAKKLKWDYYCALSGKKSKNIIYRIINRLSGYRFVKYYIGKSYGKRERLVLKNYIECEAHREILIESLEQDL